MFAFFHSFRMLIITQSQFLLQVYDPILGRWRDAEAMSMLRSRVGVAVMKNRLYAIGGYNGSERLNTVEVFDANSKQWSKVSPMNCKRRFDIIQLLKHMSFKKRENMY